MNENAERVLWALREGRASIAVWGCGHIGASAMYHFSEAGTRCAGYDIAESRVREIRQGRFLSTDIAPYVPGPGARPVSATTNWRDLVAHHPAIHIVAVPTERGAEPSSAALEDVMPLICETIAGTELEGITPAVVVESTIQPTWLDTVILPTLHAAGFGSNDVFVAAAPRRDWFSGSEHTLQTLPRIVGGSTPAATELMVALYSLVCERVIPAWDAHHAAFTKVIENLIRFQGLALANSLSLAFPQYDMTHVLNLASTKWNIPYYHPSLGIGGHCIPLAPRYALAEGGCENRYLQPVRDAVAFNDAYFALLYQERLQNLLGDCRSIVILGLAYTADAKMHKLSPALDALEVLKDTPRLRLHDPFYNDEEIEDMCGVATLAFPDDLDDCDGIILVTPHSLYREVEVEAVIRPGTVIVDNFGTWRERDFAPGVRYHEVGRIGIEHGRDPVVWLEAANAPVG